MGYDHAHRLRVPASRARATAARASRRTPPRCSTPRDAPATTSALLEGVVEVNRRQHERMVEKVARPGRRLARRACRSRSGASPSRRTPTTSATRRRSCIARRLLEEGAMVRAYDPAAGERAAALVPGLEVVADPYEACAGAAVLAVLTEWDEFRWLDFDRVARGAGSRRPCSTPATCSTRSRSAGAASPTKASAGSAIARVDARRPSSRARSSPAGRASSASHLCRAAASTRVGTSSVLDNLLTGRMENIAGAARRGPEFTLRALRRHELRPRRPARSTRCCTSRARRARRTTSSTRSRR